MAEVDVLREEYRAAAAALRKTRDHEADIHFALGNDPTDEPLDLAVLGLVIGLCEGRAKAEKEGR